MAKGIAAYSDSAYPEWLIAALIIYGEARGEPYEGKVMVAKTIIHRWLNGLWRLDHTLAATCLRYRQFSCWNLGDPNRVILMSYVDNENDKVDPAVMPECIRAFNEAFGMRRAASRWPDHFVTKAVYERWKRTGRPGWIGRCRRVGTVGWHVFLKSDKGWKRAGA